jgi:serine/threonine-protein kinase
MSRVFVAQDRKLGRRVAVKVLSREVAAEIKTERFRLEIQLAAKLQHPHIVPLLQAGEMDGILYFTMPYIDGESLRTRLDRGGALAMPDAVRVLRHIASALSYAHKQGVVHRDIKPDNVLIADEFALVTDFGVARALSESVTQNDTRLTSGGVALGTPAYMAPEQALADPEIDHRADIYSFGVLAYEVLTGEPPFRGKSAQATLAAHVVQPPDPIDTKRAGIPAAISAIVMQCLEKKPGDRPQTASDLVPIFDSASTSSPSDELAPAVPPATGPRALKWIVAAIALLAFVGVGAYMMFANRPPVVAAAPDYSSVAVLPLVNVGGDQKDEYFSDGMTDELTNALSKLPGLKVASRTSAYSFKGKNANIAEIGHALNVKTVLAGSVRRDRNKLRVSAQLASVSDGLELWSDTYETEASDVFTVQDNIAKSIAEALKVRLGGHANTFASESRGTDNVEAWENYSRGRYLLNSRGADNLRRAISYFDSAIAIDPKFARAYAANATAYALLPEYTDSPPPNVGQLAHDAASRAISLDSTLAEAYTARGLSEVHDWKFADAEASYRKALDLNPQYPTAHQWYGELLFHTGRLDPSIAQIRRAIDLDPLAPINAAAIGYALQAAGRYDESIAELKKGIELTPTLGLHHYELGAAYMMSNRTREGIPELEEAARLDPEVGLRKGYLAYGYGVTGREKDARAIIADLERRQRARHNSGVALAMAYLGLKDKENALKWLSEAVSQHEISLLTSSSLVPDQIWDPLRSDPRFDTILSRMNLLQYKRPLGRK